ncbi:MAG: hypothetical protein GY871_04150 [Actinomycetales bacterium]|nr:hypothetical protein [Actinomycetales bacterium]
MNGYVQVLDGRGPRVLVLGAEPTDAEVASSRPFVGEHGEILRKNILGKAPPHRAMLAYLSQNELEALLEAFDPQVVLALGPEVETACKELLGGKKGAPVVVSSTDPVRIFRMGWPTPKTKGLAKRAVGALKRAINKAARAANAAKRACRHPSVEEVGFWRGGKKDGEPINACLSCGEVRK